LAKATIRNLSRQSSLMLVGPIAEKRWSEETESNPGFFFPLPVRPRPRNRNDRIRLPGSRPKVAIDTVIAPARTRRNEPPSKTPSLHSPIAAGQGATAPPHHHPLKSNAPEKITPVQKGFSGGPRLIQASRRAPPPSSLVPKSPQDAPGGFPVPERASRSLLALSGGGARNPRVPKCLERGLGKIKKIKKSQSGQAGQAPKPATRKTRSVFGLRTNTGGRFRLPRVAEHNRP